MLGVCLLFAWQVNRLNDRARWVAHTDEVISWVHLCQKLMLDQETGLRGYMIAGVPSFLDPYQSGKQEFPHCVQELKTLTVDNPTPQLRISELETQYQQWRTLADPTIQEAVPTVRTSQFVEAASQRKRLMDRLRATTDGMVADEKRLLEQRRAASDAETRFTIVTLIGVLSAVGAFLIFFIHKVTLAIDKSYSTALKAREESELRERKARMAAEELAAEITERSQEMETTFLTVRNERDQAFVRLRQLESNCRRPPTRRCGTTWRVQNWRELGPDEGSALWLDALRVLGISSLNSADDLYKFGSEVNFRGGICSALGSMLCLTAVLCGARA